ncbi:MAG: prohibitin family protein, partial [Chloroflexia bacterium]|nr:prohibitin family protein [Chloroflexia bacterium]
FAGIALSKSYTTVDRGTVGVVTRFGGVTGVVFQPGLNWRTPFIDEILVVETIIQSYESSDEPTQSSADYTDIPVSAQTIDGQQIAIKYTVLFRIPADQADEIVQNIGLPAAVVENVVKANSRSLCRLLAQSYTAEDLYSGEGVFAYENEVRSSLESVFALRGIVMEDFLVRKIDFDEDYIRAIENQQIAQENIETRQYEAEAAQYEKERQIRLAEADAERIKLTAQANAEQQRLLADAEAYGIEVRGLALKEYPELVQWEFVRNLVGVQWGILPSDGVTPLIPLPEFEQPVLTPTPTVPPVPTPVPTPEPTPSTP